MNSIVFVMMVMGSHGFWTPTIEFDARDKCEVAANTIKKDIEKHHNFLSGNFVYQCIQIKK